jgi:L-aminopeptidase/D-esterase-like protein
VQGILQGQLPPALTPGTATTIGVIACDAVLTKAQCQKLAQLAHDGLARAINPAHTMWDGDTLFALATGRVATSANMLLLGVLAAEAMTRAVVNAVLSAKGLAGLPGAGELAG